jgi:tRNase Z endonuclease
MVAVLWSIQNSLRRLRVSSLQLRYFTVSSYMDWSTSVLTSLSSDTEPSVVVTFTDAKYIFNVGENISRNALQTSRTWKKARALFLTQAKIDKISGLGGKYSYSRFLCE